jgi:hypothetical protein
MKLIFEADRKPRMKLCGLTDGQFLYFTYEPTNEQLQQLHDDIGEYLQFNTVRGLVEPLTVVEVPEHHQPCGLTDPFNSQAERSPLAQADGLGDDSQVPEVVSPQDEQCLQCAAFIPPGPEFCSEGCERLFITSPAGRARLVKE